MTQRHFRNSREKKNVALLFSEKKFMHHKRGQLIDSYEENEYNKFVLLTKRCRNGSSFVCLFVCSLSAVRTLRECTVFCMMITIRYYRSLKFLHQVKFQAHDKQCTRRRPIFLALIQPFLIWPARHGHPQRRTRQGHCPHPFRAKADKQNMFMSFF